jgi:cytochrome c55X
LLLVLTAGGAYADVSAGRQEALLHLLKHDCGSCHGMTLRGGLGPSLLPDALRGRSEDQLVNTVLDGRPGTPMPPWRPFLSEEEARWLIRFLRGER